MKTQCPNCGAELEFRYDDSFVRICSYCRTAIARTDRGVDSLGKVADLTPIESPLRLFAEGHFGSASFLLVGMAQIKHEAGGIWQEWYAKFDGGRWGWLAEAQGRYYLTFEEAWTPPPSLAQLAPGAAIDLPVRGAPHRCTVSEITTASYIAAMGELPFKLVPNGPFRYADLSDGRGTFATIDFGGEGDPPSLYVGAQVPLADLKISGGEVAPPQATPIASTRLACPNCNAPLELRVPDQTQRVVCASCNQLIDTSSGVLRLLGQLAGNKATPQIPLGLEGTFPEGPMTVIGYVQRAAYVDDSWWPFDEYLLHSPKLGFRWLVDSDGHWSYVQTVEAGAVETTAKGCAYDGVKFVRYQQAQLRVDQVLGEFYWQVTQGETVESEDLIAPPAMLSREATASEENWSLSTYMTVAEVQHAFGDKQLPLGSPQGVAPNQPDAWTAASGVMSIAFMGLVVIGILFAMAAKNQLVYAHDVPISSAPPVAASPVSDPLAAATTPDAVPPECVEYKAITDAVAACATLPKASRDAMADVYRVTTTGPSSRDALATACQAGVDAIRQALGSQCTLPAHSTGSAAAAARPMRRSRRRPNRRSTRSSPIRSSSMAATTSRSPCRPGRSPTTGSAPPPTSSRRRPAPIPASTRTWSTTRASTTASRGPRARERPARCSARNPEDRTSCASRVSTAARATSPSRSRFARACSAAGISPVRCSCSASRCYSSVRSRTRTRRSGGRTAPVARRRSPR